MEAGNKKLVWQFLIFIVVFVVAFFGTKYMIPKIIPNYELGKVAAEMNKKGPVMIDAQTRLDNSSASGDTLFYNYTLVSVTAEDPGFNSIEAKEFVKAGAQKNLDTNPNMIYFREKKIILKYLYKDKSGKALFDFTINAK